MRLLSRGCCLERGGWGAPGGPPGTGRRMRRSQTEQQNEAFPGKHERPGGNSEGRRAAGTQAGKTAKAMQTHLFVGLHAPQDGLETL